VVDEIYLDDKIKDYILDLIVFATREPAALKLARLHPLRRQPRAPPSPSPSPPAPTPSSRAAATSPAGREEHRPRCAPPPRARLLRGRGRAATASKSTSPPPRAPPTSCASSPKSSPPGRSSPRTDLAPALEYLNHVVRRRSVAFLVSDFIAPPCDHLLRVTARRHDLVSLVVGDKRESALPAAGLVDFEDPETGRRIVVDTSHAPTRRALLARHTERREQLLRRLRAARSDAIELHAGEPYDRELVRFFRLREKRR
jgi:hypothetical protein